MSLLHLKLPRHEKNGEHLLVLFDAMALAYRAYFAFITRPLRNAKGENTSAVYGFINALLQFLEHHSPTYAAVCFDTAAPTFRHERYEAYKATRQAMPEDLVPQLQMIKDLVKAYGICLIEQPGYEADDIIGTLAKRAEKEQIETLIVTPDKDFCQLVTPLTKLLRPSKEGREMEIVDEKCVEEKYGLQPIQIIDYLALVGDASDNIPGVRGIGEKSAAPIIQQFGSVVGIYENLEKVEKKGIREKLTVDRDNAFLSYELATIDTNVPLPFELHDLKYTKHPDEAALIAMLQDFGFKSLIARIHAQNRLDEVQAAQNLSTTATAPAATSEEDQLASFDFSLAQPEPSGSSNKTIRDTPHAYVMVDSEDALAKLAEDLQRSPEICVDLETTSSDANRAEIIGVALSRRPHEAFYVPVLIPISDSEEGGSLFDTKPVVEEQNAQNAYNTGLPIATVVKHLKPLLENDSVRKVGQNIKYDALALMHAGVTVKPVTFDTMVGGYILRQEGSHSMDALAIDHLNYRPVALTDVVGPIRETNVRQVMTAASTEKLAEYAAEDADITLQLKRAIEPKLQQAELLKLCETVEFPLVEVLTEMEFHGVKLDTKMLGLASKEMEQEAEKVCAKIYEYAGGPFNIDSPKQLQEILFTRLGLTPGRKTKTGLSTNAYVLEELMDAHPIAECILQYRQYQKLRSTYVDALPQLVNKRTGMVHTSYNQAVVATGRISSTNPNLQNIPIKTDLGRDIRKAFVSRWTDGQILSADYSQIELRIMAHVAQDESLIRAFENNADIHTATAAGVFGVPEEEVTREMRGRAKGINYGIMYGIGAFGLARNLKIPQKEASDIIKRYFIAFPRIKQYMDSTIERARETGYVETLLGRRRYFKNLNVSNQAVRGNDERAAINAPIQGTAADMMKLAMIALHREMKARQMKSLMIMQVHDELVFDVTPDEADTLLPLVKELMSGAMPMSVPIVVDAGIGRTWFEAH